MTSYRLKDDEAATMTLPGGGTITYQPISKPSFDAAGAVARKRTSALSGDDKTLRLLGLLPEDLKERDGAQAVFHYFHAVELAVRNVTGWAGIADLCGTKEAPCTPDNIRKLMRQPEPNREFYGDVLFSLLPDATIKKGSGTGADGISDQVPNTAGDAGIQEPPVTPQEAPTTESSAPTSNTD